MIPIHQVSQARRMVVRQNNVKNLSSNSIVTANTNGTTSLRKRLFASSSLSSLRHQNLRRHDLHSISNTSTVRRGFTTAILQNRSYSFNGANGAKNGAANGHQFLLTSAVLTGCLTAHNVHKNNASCEQSNGNEAALDIKSLEKEWEDFMQKAMNPEEDDDDEDDDEEEEDEEDDDEVDEEEEQERNNDEASNEDEDNDVTQEEQGEGEEGVSLSSSAEVNNNEATQSEIQSTLLSNEIVDQKAALEVVEEEEVNLDNAADENELESEENQISPSTFQEESKDRQKLDPYDNLPEEDEPTTCTICLINRQGPCRPLWRKFEHCMKDHGGDDNDDDDNSKKSSLGEMCDQYMMPWIGCIQGYKNTYTLIANEFFQKELVDDIESTIADNEKVLLENIDISSIVQMSDEWWSSNSRVDGAGESEDSSGNEEGEGSDVSSSNDVVLVEGMAKINLFDGDKPVLIAYVKDQDGKMLGYDQFTDFKKELLESDEKESDKKSTPTIGQCAFHISPENTKSIQIYALYRSKEDKEDDNQKGDENNADDAKSIEQTLYYSSAVLMDDIENPSKKKDNTE